MKSIEQLEKAYAREVELSEKHKKAAADIRKQMEHLQGKLITQKINSMNMSGPEYDRFIKLLSSGKKTVLEAADQVLGNKKLQEKGEGIAGEREKQIS